MFAKIPRSMNVLGKDLYPKDSINHKDHPEHNKPGFLVRATKTGHYECALREEGDEFRIQYARHFADASDPAGYGWMERLGEDESKKPKKRRTDDDDEPRGAKPRGRDPEERAQAMKKFDKMVAEIREDEKSEDVI